MRRCFRRFLTVLVLLACLSCRGVDAGAGPDGDADDTPPDLVALLVAPESAFVRLGASLAFLALGIREDGDTIELEPVWHATGGSIGRDGVYLAGSSVGNFEVAVSMGRLTDTARVAVVDTVPTPPYLPPSDPQPCAERGPPTLILSGTQNERLDDREGLAAAAIIDAWAAYWPEVHDYPVLVGGGDGWCWSGGRIEGFWTDETSWEDMHGRTAFEDYGGAGTVLEGLWIRNYGDGLTIRATADNWTLRRSRFVHLRDDCIENDYERGGLVEDVFFEGCYSGFSARPSDVNLGGYSGADQVWTIQNSLVWLEPMAEPYKGTPPNTSGFFKWDKSEYDSSPELVLRGNVFRADMVPADGTLCLAPPGKLIESTSNVIVWLGDGPYPCLPLPTGWTLTTDRRFWDAAVSRWQARNPEH